MRVAHDPSGLRPGAGDNIAAEVVTRAALDGDTLFRGGATMVRVSGARIE